MFLYELVFPSILHKTTVSCLLYFPIMIYIYVCVCTHTHTHRVKECIKHETQGYRHYHVIHILQYKFLLVMWSYASHRAQCGVTTSHSTCCGCCVHDYHICFQLFTLLNPSMPMLYLKDPQRGVDTIQPDLLMVR